MAINARSRRSRTVSVGMLSMSLRHSVASSTGVLPVFTTCFGPRTAAAGFIGTTWPMTSQSNSIGPAPQRVGASPSARWSGVPHPPAMPYVTQRGTAPASAGGWLRLADGRGVGDFDQLLLGRANLRRRRTGSRVARSSSVGVAPPGSSAGPPAAADTAWLAGGSAS